VQTRRQVVGSLARAYPLVFAVRVQTAFSERSWFGLGQQIRGFQRVHGSIHTTTKSEAFARADSFLVSRVFTTAGLQPNSTDTFVDAHYGPVTQFELGGAATVPEPSTITLTALGVAALIRRRVRYRPH
jgi:hypothetical protein